MIVKATSVLISPDILSGNQPLELIKVVLIPDNKYGLVSAVLSFNMYAFEGVAAIFILSTHKAWMHCINKQFTIIRTDTSCLGYICILFHKD